MARIITQSMEGSHFFRWGSILGQNGAPVMQTVASVGTIPELDGSRVLNTGPFDGSRAIPLTLNGSGAAVTPSEIFAGFFFCHDDPDNSSVAPVGGTALEMKHRLMSFWTGTTGICTVKINPVNQKLQFQTGAAVFGHLSGSPTFAADSTQGAAFSENTVYHVQIRVKLDGASSIVQVRLNDVIVIDWTGTLSGSTIDRVMTHSAGGGFADTNGTLYLATIIINDTTADGTSNNTWPGVRRLKLQNISGVGFYSQFSPQPVVPNFQNVDDIPNNGDTDYNLALSSGLKDSFPVSPNGLNALQVTYKGWFEEVIARKTGGTFGIQLGVRRLATDYLSGTTLPLGVSYDVYDHWRETDPSSLLAWTSAGLDATEIIYSSV